MPSSKQPKIYAAFLVFAAVLLLLNFAAGPIQLSLGIWGLLLTEVIIFACAVIAIVVFRYDIKEVIPIKRPRLRQVFGVLLLWAGALFIGFLSAYISMFLFPEKMASLTKALGAYMTEGPFLLTLVIAALMPAICEETLCRGFIQYSLGGIRNKWLVILIVGVIFGVFHMSPFRFAPTMVLGFTLAYIMVETKNILLPMILHFTNNSVSLIMSYATNGARVQADPALLSKTSVITIGIMLFVCAVVPWLFLAGSRLLHPKVENKQNPIRNRRLIVSIFVTVFCVVAGIAVTVVGTGALMGELKVLDMKSTKTVSAASSTPDTFPVNIKADGNYQLSYVVTSSPGSDGTTSFSLTGEDGTEYLSMTAESLYGNTQKHLPAGDYTLKYEYHYQNADPADVQINFIIMKMPG